MSKWIVFFLMCLGCAQPESNSKTSIFWGEPVVGSDFAQVGSILYSEDEELSLVCSAVYYRNEYILSAAHCLERLQKNHSPEQLATNLFFSTDNKIPRNLRQLESTFLIESFQIHPYRDKAPVGDHDIALLKLSQTPNIRGVEPYINTRLKWLSFQNNPAGSYTIVGSGLDENGTRGIKRFAKLSGALDFLNPYEVLTPAGPDSCQGDSGGPLFSGGKLVGLASRGESCGNGGVVTLFHPYACWVESVIENNNSSHPLLCGHIEDNPSSLLRNLLLLQRVEQPGLSLSEYLSDKKKVRLMGLNIQSLAGIEALFDKNESTTFDLRGNLIKTATVFDLALWKNRRVRLEGNFMSNEAVPGQWATWLPEVLIEQCERGDHPHLIATYKAKSCIGLAKKVYALETLSLADKPVGTLNFLSGLINLKTLVLENTRIEAKTALPWLPNLEKVFIGENDFSVQEWVSYQHNLKHVEVLGDLFSNATYEPSDIANDCLNGKDRFIFEKVRSGMPRDDLSCRTVSKFMITTHSLNLSEASRIQFLGTINQLTQLTSLDISGSGVQDIAGLKNLKNLEELNLSNCKIDSLQVAERLTNLKKLIVINAEVRVDSKKLLRKLKSRGVQIVTE